MTPATVIFLELLRSRTTSFDAARVAKWTATEWDELQRLARAHAVAPLLFHRLTRLNLAPPVAPAPVWESLRRAYLINAARNTRLAHEQAALIEALRAASIPGLVLKGLHLAATAYDHPALRVIGDVDLLVPAADAERAYAQIRSLGYRPHTGPDSPDALRLAMEHGQHLPELVRPGSVRVELHWTLGNPLRSRPLPLKEIWNRAVPVRLEGEEFRGLAPEDNLLFVAWHAARHHLFETGLRPLCDAEGMLARGGERPWDWEAIAALATAWGWARSMALFLSVTRRLLDGALPDPARAWLERYPDVESIADDACDTILVPPQAGDRVTVSLARVWRARTPWGKARAGLRGVFVPPRHLAHLYSVSPRSPKLAWYYLVRLRDVLRRHGRSGWKLHRGDRALRARAADKSRLIAWLTDET